MTTGIDEATAAVGPEVRFGGLRVPVRPHVLVPRPWTLSQSEWAVELDWARPGPVFELFAGSGHIGLEVTRRTGRPAVLVDASADACATAGLTAHRNGLAALVEIRCRQAEAAIAPHDRPGMILADPPYVPRQQVDRFPDDPRPTIDGGPDGLEVTRRTLRAIAGHVGPEVPFLLQLRGRRQVEMLASWLGGHRDIGLAVTEVRSYGPDRAIARLSSRR